SSWDDPELEDRDRPLAKRGIKDASRMGAWMVRKKLTPQVVLCSQALRARATLTLVLAEMHDPLPEIRYERALYLAEPAQIIERIQNLDRKAGTLLVVGHNPGLHAAALALVGSGPRKRIGAIAAAFPTASLAVIEFDLPDWSKLRPGAGHLRTYTSPK